MDWIDLTSKRTTTLDTVDFYRDDA